MEEIKVGDFVRTKEGIIDKIDAFNINTNIYHCENGLCIDKENKIAVALKDIKHSKNIIDLVECGDYVNGYRIDNIINGVLVNRAVGLDRSGVLTPIAQYENDIKTILTKEQFEQNLYKV